MMREIVSWRVPIIDARSRRDTGRSIDCEPFGVPPAVPPHEDEQKVHELVAVRQRRLTEHRVVSMFKLEDRAFEKSQAERRIAGQQRRDRRAIDMAHHARTQCLRAGLVLAAGEERTVSDRVAGIGEPQQHRVAVGVEPADSDRATGDAVHAVVAFALREDDLA